MGSVSPLFSSTTPAKYSICVAAISASICLALTGLPQSAASSSASSSAWARTIDAAWRRQRACSSGGVAAQPAKARDAAATAVFTSSSVPQAKGANRWPLLGLRLSRRLRAGCQLPPQ